MLNAILFRGLWGSIYSRGMDTLSLDLQKLDNVDYVIVLPYTAVQHAVNLVSQFKDRTVLIGHSFGVGALLEVAKALPNVEFPAAFSFDPSQYWSGQSTLTPNIKKCVNFWQDAPFWMIGNQQLEGAENIHVDTTHIAIDDRKDLHQRVISDVRAIK